MFTYGQVFVRLVAKIFDIWQSLKQKYYQTEKLEKPFTFLERFGIMVLRMGLINKNNHG